MYDMKSVKSWVWERISGDSTVILKWEDDLKKTQFIKII